ncbi:MAG: sigma-54-dependent Fis family transcriptional regulator [Gammaproteobacteria bacterium]|nr:sigma-54-dependent Fis family transcriptional regulator [Gammaproteobacteria bacterium]MDE2346084.1 sigma-54-dependent Fis family transcriptional regulator [Gammaproteobacteria bacterium]
MRASQILVVDDEADIRDMVQEILTEEGYEVRVASNAAEARAIRAQQDLDLVLLDIWMPDMDGISLLKEWNRENPLSFPVVMMSGHGTVETAIEATKLGALDFVEKPLSLAKLLRTVGHAIEVGRQARAQRIAGGTQSPLDVMGKSRPMQVLRDQCRRVAPHESMVMLVGEPGSGRESIARHIHALSPRAAGPFVNMVFTGLSTGECEKKFLGCELEGRLEKGCLDEARQGSLYLNDVTDMLPETQNLVLKVLQQGRYAHVGGQIDQNLDVRLLVSARPEIETRLADGGFRSDLYALLAAVAIRVPPLREYREDVPELLRYYTDLLADSGDLKYRRFSVAAQNRLRNYPWPGNLQELRNLVQRCLMLGDESEVSLEEVEGALAPYTAEEPLVKQDLLAMPLREAREHFERAYLQQQLQLCGGKVGKLAERVGMERTHLYRKLNSLGIDFRSLGGDENDA